MRHHWQGELWAITRTGEYYVSHRVNLRLRGPLWYQRAYMLIWYQNYYFYLEHDNEGTK